MESFDVVVIGAGMAGLTAARALAERGLRVCVVEAQERVGGRILTRRADGETIELGAEFVHGRPPELWALIEEAGLSTYELEGTMVRSVGQGEFAGQDEEDEDEDERFGLLDDLEDYSGQDCSFMEYLDQTGVPEEARSGIVGYVEGFNAADARLASVKALGVQQKAEDAIEADRVWRVRDGYDRLPQYLAERIIALGSEIRLGIAATEIFWEAGAIRVRVTGGTELQAERLVVAIPLGALQANGLRFSPAPGDRLELAHQLRMGQVCRFTMVFRERFWEATQPEMSFLFTFEHIPSVWWTTYPACNPTLTGWVGGPRSDALAGLSPEELAERGCAGLSRVFGVDVRRLLVECHVHEWRGDPWTGGAYSYIPAGQLETPAAMGEAVEDTIYFAGEHTDTTGHWGTVHAAMRSGLRAAEQILQGFNAHEKRGG